MSSVLILTRICERSSCRRMPRHACQRNSSATESSARLDLGDGLASDVRPSFRQHHSARVNQITCGVRRLLKHGRTQMSSVGGHITREGQQGNLGIAQKGKKGPQGNPAAHSVPPGYSSGRKGPQGIALLRRIRCLLGSSGRKGQQDIYSPAAPQLVPSGFTGIYEILRIVYETWGVAFPNALNGEAFL